MEGNGKVKIEYSGKEPSDKRPNPYRKDVIVDPMGQLKFPGQITKIPSGDITMQGVNYPVLGIDNLGNQQMMHPGADYTFPGDSVTEYPQMESGGWLDEYKKGGQKRLPKKFISKNLKTSINQLMTRNYMMFGPEGKHNYYWPDLKRQQGGEQWLDQFSQDDNWLEKYK